MDHRSAIQAYFEAFRTRDRNMLERVLAPDMRHRSPFGQYHDRDRMLDEIWPHIGLTWAVDLEIYGDGPGYMVRYRHNVPGAPAMAEHVRFDGDRIVEIEVYLSQLPDAGMTLAPNS